MSKFFRVHFESNRGEHYHQDLPTRDEAKERMEDLRADGYLVNEQIQEVVE